MRNQRALPTIHSGKLLFFYVLLQSLVLIFSQQDGFCLKPNEVLLIVNNRSVAGASLAKYYMEQRNIPEENIFRLSMTDRETCYRSEYEEKLAKPLRQYLKSTDNSTDIRCLLTFYGLPLRIKPDISKTQIGNYSQPKDPVASLDSELTMVKIKKYPLGGWIKNPFYFPFQKEKSSKFKKGDVLMVSRLDATTPRIVNRIINDSIEAEKTDLKGNAYFDARWPFKENEKNSGYGLYDRSIHLAAQKILQNGIMPVYKNDVETLFGEGECPKTALYCGWYSLGKYINSFEWEKGSVGYHIASSELRTLKNKNSEVWGKRILEEGAAATIGPVGEPYVQAFPMPEIFFTFITDGYFTLAESYFLSVPFISWKMVLIGDPLYKPFKNI